MTFLTQQIVIEQLKFDDYNSNSHHILLWDNPFSKTFQANASPGVQTNLTNYFKRLTDKLMIYETACECK